MKIILAKETGFCFGVKRAINLTEDALKKSRDTFIVGDLIHNRFVTKEFEKKGLKKISNIDDKDKGTLIVRAHGLPPEEFKKARDKGLDVVDATCPIVQKAQNVAKELEEGGYQVIVIGDKKHAEVKGIIGMLKSEAKVVGSLSELKECDIKDKVGVVFQTTQSIALCKDIIDLLLEKAKEVKVINTVCSAIQKKQEETIELAKKVDAMIVVGDKGSANTIKLKALAEKYNKRTLQIENAAELDRNKLNGAETVGLIGGASTPDWIIEEVKAKLLNGNTE